MSRFYEALKQASQALHSPRETAGSEEVDLSELLSEPGAVQAADSPAVETLLAPSGEMTTSPAAPQNGALGKSAQAAFDKTAPLIPNADEPTILEHYRVLRTSILQQRTEKMFRSLLVASAEPKEGKTITVVNMALAFAMLPSFKVLAVDGDIRRGNLSRWLGIESQPGLSDLLEGSVKLEDVVLRSSEIPFCFVGRGNSKLPPPELLHSGRWADYLKKMTQQFDLVLVDSPPVSVVTDAQLLASGCEAVLLVARPFHTSRELLAKTRHDFGQFRVIGTVLNGGESVGGYGSDRRYRSYYTEESKPVTAESKPATEEPKPARSSWFSRRLHLNGSHGKAGRKKGGSGKESQTDPPSDKVEE